MPYAQPGGPKILRISLKNDSVYATYIFPALVYYPEIFMNIHLNLRRNLTSFGQGVAYIVDSSDEGRPGFTVLDLGTGKSWRRSTQHPSVLRVDRDVPSYQDGLQLNLDGSRLYYSPLTSDYLYSIPAANLLAPPTDPSSEVAAKNNVTHHRQRSGNANGFEGDPNGLIYQLIPEQNANYYYDRIDLQTHAWVRDPRIVWPDGASIAQNGYLYMNINQLPYQSM